MDPGAAGAHLVRLAGLALDTYRWLRIGLLAALGVVLASGLLEWWHAPGHCLQGSLSAYYWTPVRPILVGGLMAFALGLIAVRGSTDAEDVALNLGGLVLPLVAVVPVRPSSGCSSVQAPVPAILTVVDNNVRALLIVAVVVVAAIAVRMVRGHVMRRSSWIGWSLAAALVAGFSSWSLAAPSSLEPAAHYVAAVGAFGCLTTVVLLNAWHTPRSGLTRLYAALALVMVVAVLLQLAHELVGSTWSLLATEALLVGAFATFWLVQTVELWDAGVRPSVTRPQGRSSA